MVGPTLALDLDITAPAVEGASLQTTSINDATVPVAGKTEFWNAPQHPQGAHFAAPVGVFFDEADDYASGTKRKIAAAIFGGLFSLLGAGLAWNFFVNNVSPVDSLNNWWNLAMGVDEVTPVVHKPKAKKIDVADVVDDTPNIKPVIPGRILPTPYRNLTNEMADQHHRRNVRMTGEEENIIREGLNHEFYYQRFLAVQETVQLRRDGSEAILREALQDGKFWMKMYAVFGLADLGYKVSEDDIKQAFAGSHDELRERFLSRFEANECSLGCEYVLRGAMSFLHARPRLEALKVLGKNAAQSTGDYMVAATFDSDEKIRTYAKQWLLKNPVEESEWWRVYNAIAVEDSEAAGAPLSEG